MKCSASEPGLRSGKLQSLPEKIILCNLSISHGWIKNLKGSRTLILAVTGMFRGSRLNIDSMYFLVHRM